MVLGMLRERLAAAGHGGHRRRRRRRTAQSGRRSSRPAGQRLPHARHGRPPAGRKAPQPTHDRRNFGHPAGHAKPTSPKSSPCRTRSTIFVEKPFFLKEATQRIKRVIDKIALEKMAKAAPVGRRGARQPGADERDRPGAVARDGPQELRPHAHQRATSARCTSAKARSLTPLTASLSGDEARHRLVLELRPGDLDDRDRRLAPAGRGRLRAGPFGRQARIGVAGRDRGRSFGGTSGGGPPASPRPGSYSVGGRRARDGGTRGGSPSCLA